MSGEGDPGGDGSLRLGAALGLVTVAAVIVAVSLAVAVSLFYAFGGFEAEPSGYDLEVIYAAFQGAVIALTWAAASRGQSAFARLGLNRPQASAGLLAVLTIAMGLIWFAGLAVSVTFFRHEMLQDIGTYANSFRGDTATAAIAAATAVIGSPVSEELLFRGYLLAGLIRAGTGTIAAVLISNTLWTALHIGYSTPGLIDVFVAGLMFSLLTWATRSVWPAILAHAAHNIGALAVMVWLTGAWPEM